LIQREKAMHKKVYNTKKTRRLTLSIAILMLVNHLIWRNISFIIFATNKRGDWEFWGISTMSYDEIFLWQANYFLSIICFLSLPFSFVLFVTMFVYYIKLRKNKEVSKIPYFVILFFQIALIVFSVASKMFTIFGVFWFVLNITIIMLSVFVMKTSANESDK